MRGCLPGFLERLFCLGSQSNLGEERVAFAVKSINQASSWGTEGVESGADFAEGTLMRPLN